MFAVIVITHGDLGKSLVDAANLIVKKHHLTVIAHGLQANDDIEQQRQILLKTVQSLNTTKNVIILTDMFGGTPCNLAISCLSKGSIEVIAGVNLSMLVKAATLNQDVDFDHAINAIQNAGRNSIHTASLLLSEKNKAAV